MPDTYSVEPRTTLGKRVARLRREGVLPANVFGRGIESVAVQIDERAVRELLQSHGLNTLISLQVAGEDEPRPVVVRDVGRHPVTRTPLHLDFYQVDLVEALPADMPNFVTVSIDGLLELDDEVTVADLEIPESITVLSDPHQMLVRITRPRGLAADEEEGEGEEAEGEGAEDEGAEGAEESESAGEGS